MGNARKIVCTSVQWACGHYTTTIGGMPRYCPVCTGRFDDKLLKWSNDQPLVEYPAQAR
jgi:hypothetical protein